MHFGRINDFNDVFIIKYISIFYIVILLTVFNVIMGVCTKKKNVWNYNVMSITV